MRNSSMRLMPIVAGLFVLLFAMSASASIEGVVVKIGDTCWYNEGTMQLPVDIEWATWSEYPDCGMEYWFPWFSDNVSDDPQYPLPCDRDNEPLPVCWPEPDCYWDCPTYGYYIDTCGRHIKCTKSMSCELFTADPDMCSFHMILNFDPNVVEAWGAVNGTLIGDWAPITYVINNDEGFISIGGFSSICKDLTQLTDPTDLVWVDFKVRGWAEPGDNAGLCVDYFGYDATEWPYVYYSCECYEPYFNHPCSLYTDSRTIGNFVVCELDCVNGWVAYCGHKKPICYATVKLEYVPNFDCGYETPRGDAYYPPNIDNKQTLTQCDASCVFDCRGTYVMCDILDQYDYCLSVWKQGNSDDAVSPLDASLVMRSLVAQQDLSYCGYTAADVDGDCDVTTLDACGIMKYLVGDPEWFPYFPRKASENSNWVFFQARGDGPCGGCDFALFDGFGACPPEMYCYNPLWENQWFQNFWGVYLGDVSGNWGFGPNSPVDTVGPKITISPIADVINVTSETIDGETVYTVMASIDDVYACQFEVSANASVETNDGWLSESRVANGVTRFVAAGATTARDGILAIITAAPEADVTISGMVVNETTLNGSMTMKGIAAVPAGYRLASNYPNPFNPATNISFTIPKATDVKLTVYNVLGQNVNTLVNGALEAGEHTVVWNGTDASGSQVSSGVYLYRLETTDFSETKKMTLLK